MEVFSVYDLRAAQQYRTNPNVYKFRIPVHPQDNQTSTNTTNLSWEGCELNGVNLKYLKSRFSSSNSFCQFRFFSPRYKQRMLFLQV